MGDMHRDRSVLDAFPRSPLVEYTTAVMNASLAAMNMNVAAEALGVSSVMLSETGRSGMLDAAFLKESLRLPDGGVSPADYRVRLRPGSTPANAAQAATRRDLLRGRIPRGGSLRDGGLAGADGGRVQGQPLALIL